MAFVNRRGGRPQLDIWPGWVDALSSLLMVIVFLLMVFVLAQFYLSTALQGRDRQLEQLNSRIAELADLLALERDTAARLETELSQVTERLRSTLGRNEELAAEISRLEAVRDTLTGRIATLEGESARQQAEAAQALTDQEALTEAARQEVALLNDQLAALRAQLQQLAATLDASEQKAKEQEAQIADLGKRLNAALASKVAELVRFRSEFFGRLREALGERDDVRIVGDRFVFQSEVLFASGSAELGEAGRERLGALARTLVEIAAKIPTDIEWILRVDGHTDAIPIRSGRFPSNWELSTARATEVVQFLIAQGIPPERLAAAGFGEFQPLEPGTSPEVLGRNRRIEIKLDAR